MSTTTVDPQSTGGSTSALPQSGSPGAGYFLREEAHPMTWKQLFEPEKDAVAELLTRMNVAKDAASTDSSQRPELAPCFLVAGQRGTGKTTVLLNTRHALEDTEEFIKGSESDPRLRPLLSDSEDPLTKEIIPKKALRELSSHIIWLDQLDMEFFPRGGNLLTALLVRVRSALDVSRTDRRSARADPDSSEPRSHATRRRGLPAQLVEEGEADAWSKIDDLIRHATIMWEQAEQVMEQDLGVKVEQQINVAETNAEFKAALTTAIKAVVSGLVEWKLGSRYGDVALVLPIDNADRSAYHISQVIKLIRLVSSPNVWYVLAGSDQDLDVFVEDSYRQQTGIKDSRPMSGGPPGAVAGAAPQEPRIVGIARRQAAADVRSVLPPANRIKIECLLPADALAFPRRDQLRGNASRTRLFDVLKELRIRPPTKQGKDEQGKEGRGQPETVLDLLVLDDSEPTELTGNYHDPAGLRSRLEKGGKACEVVSQAGELALALPARGVLDAYQLAQLWWARQRNDSTEDRPAFAALGFARDMLQNAIAESELPEWACRRLTEKVLFEDGAGRICLDLRGDPIGWVSRNRERGVLNLTAAVNLESRDPQDYHQTIVGRNRPELVLNDFYGFKLFLRFGDKEKIELPDRVAGWLMILYDILRSFPEPRIIEDAVDHPDRDPPVLVETRHTVPIWGNQRRGWHSCRLRFFWRAPRFDTFFDYDVLARRWARLQRGVTDKLQLRAHEENPKEWCLLAVFQWIDVCSSIGAGMRDREWRPPDGAANDKGRDDVTAKYATDLPRRFEQQGKLKDWSSSRPAFTVWMRDDMPLFFGPEFKWLSRTDWSWDAKLWVREQPDGRSSPEAEVRLERRWAVFQAALDADLKSRAFIERGIAAPMPDEQQQELFDRACCKWFDEVDGFVEERLRGPKQPPWIGWLTPRPDLTPTAARDREGS